MSKKIIQNIINKYVPNPETITKHKNLQFLGDRLHTPNLWHINRHSVSAAVAIGLFFAWVPTPTQMLFAAIAALYFRAHLLVSVALVWVTNPITMPPMFYFAYLVGLRYSHSAASSDDFVFSLEGMWTGLEHVIGPFLLGCLIMGLVCSLGGYIGMDAFWRYHIKKRWADRKQKRSGHSIQ
jgi:uncharacterized protein